MSAHGVAGKIKVAPYSGDPTGILEVRRLRLGGPPGEEGGAGGREYDVETAQRSAGCAVFALKGISTAEGALALKGARVWVPRADLPPPGEDEYYHADLAGCTVTTAEGIVLGVVAAVVEGPAHDWLEIRTEGGESALLPIVAEFIKEVDVAGRHIVAAPPQGWPP